MKRSNTHYKGFHDIFHMKIRHGFSHCVLNANTHFFILHYYSYIRDQSRQIIIAFSVTHFVIALSTLHPSIRPPGPPNEQL